MQPSGNKQLVGQTVLFAEPTRPYKDKENVRCLDHFALVSEVVQAAAGGSGGGSGS